MLGQHGRLGNQMFQYATLLGIGSKNGYSVAIPKQHHSLKECFKIKSKAYDFNSSAHKIINSMNFYREKYFHFNDNIFELGDNIIYAGNFQTEKYFNHCEELIREQFTFNDHIFDKAFNFINNIKKIYTDKILISVHVRRGDYLHQQDSHPVQDVEWYKNAFNEFNLKDSLFVVFSDDIEWCKKNILGLPNILFSSLNNNFEDLCAMSLCDSHIIANSSFSWWGAWLNLSKNKKIIAPYKWFGNLYLHHNTKDLYCKNWKIL